MTLPRWWARSNRVLLNPLVRRFAWWMPGLGVIVHRGRRSGREYLTPVIVLTGPDGYVVMLPYGTACDWVRNVEAAGTAGLHSRRRLVALVPKLVHHRGHPALPRVVRGAAAAVGVHDYLELTPRS
jgi:deazaflavin-dependent oxidoreductase (nitroreductase family)